MSYTFDSFDPDTFNPFDREDDPAYAVELTLDDDIGIHAGAIVLYDSPCRLTLQGVAWTHDPHADRWLVELATGAGSRVEWCAGDRLRIICTAECANWAQEVG